MKKRLIWTLSFFIILIMAGFVFLQIREWSIIDRMNKENIELKKKLASDEEGQPKLKHRAKSSTVSSEVESSTESETLDAYTKNLRTEDATTLADKSSDKGKDGVTETTIKETEQNRRKSLFDFGIYPDVPLGLFPHGEEVWDEIENLAERDSEAAIYLELMVRVRIKLWELGTETVGASMNPTTGLILPSIPNVAYVTYGMRETEDGETKQYIQMISGGGGLTAIEYEMVEEGITPSGWTIQSPESGGIDPYLFLELE